MKHSRDFQVGKQLKTSTVLNCEAAQTFGAICGKLNEKLPMPRNLFVGGAEQDQLSETDDDERTPTEYATQPKQFQIPTGTRQRHPRPYNSQHERPERSAEPARITELEERTRVLEMAMDKILTRLIPDDPLIPLLNRDSQPIVVVATRNSSALSNVVVPTKPRGSGRLNPEPSSSKRNEELLKKNADLERQLKDVQKSIDELKSPRDYMQRFNKATLDIDNVPDTICLSALLHGLKRGRFLNNLLENPPKSWNEIQHWVKRPTPQTHDSSRADKIKYCDYHHGYGHNTEDCQSLKDELEFLARNGKLEGRVNIRPSRTEHTRDAYSMGGQSTRGRKAYARQVMTVNKNRPLKRPFKETEWENAPITFSSTDYKRADGEPDIMMPHANPFVATVHIGNHNVNKGVGVLKGNQKMARACYQDTFKKVELVAAPAGSENHRPTQLDQETMSISDIEHRPKGVEQKAEPVELVETVHLNPDVLERIVKIGTKLTEEERAELLEFLRVNQDVFAWTIDEMLGIPAELTVHKLNTNPTKRPVVQKRYLFGPEKQAAIDEEIQKLLQAGFIRRVEYSEWVSNPVLVKKPNSKWKMCIDFTNLNETCPKYPHPLPNVEKLVERVAGHERMSFLTLAQDQKLVQIIFKLQIGRNIEVYVDDMIVTNVRVEDYIDDLSETFQNLCRAQMKLNPLKCTFIVESGKFLGYVVSKKGIEVNPEKVQAIQQMEPPKTVKDVQRLTGRVAALHRFIARSKERCLSFFKALREPKNFQWTDEWESLYLYLGVTEEAVSSILLREENKNQKPICYAMVDFLVECILATVEEKAPEHPVWVLYVDRAANIKGSGARAVLVGPNGFISEHALRFKFQTTNNAAEYEVFIYGLKLASELKVQSIQVFSDSQLMVGQIDKIPRADNQQADKLSKLASSQDINPQRSTLVEVLDAPSYIDFTIECQLLSTDPSSPSWTTPLIEYLHSGKLPEDPFAAKLIKRKAAHFTLLDNQLYKRAASMPLLRCLTPYEAEYAVREVHEGVCGTHIGGRTLARKLLRHGYYWPTMVEDAQNYVKKCPTCQFNADDIHMPGIFVETREMLSSLSSPWPFAQWGVDLLGPFVKGKGGCTYLVVAFQAATLKSFCNDYGIELALTSIYTPQSNGQAESANKIVLRGLKTRVLAAHSNWVDELSKVLWSCRTTPSSATSETSFSLTYGAEAVIPIEVGLPSDRLDRHDDLNNEQLLRENLDLVEEVREMS
ncbi:hypothetical protein SLEP1_g24525 [Rubroshorea leprosula]|uniref:Uncharacterized protein n=1 Tax=Rubroshorea leprosula TaxID=152421 RepID=A0AAV5JRH8_9ROSI|nr:hypothetical protein SLEP1_g24525 [Rubroshorea leprosula]